MTASRTIAEQLQRAGVSRRNFITFCGKIMVAAPVGLALTNKLSPQAMAATIGKAKRPSVIWLEMQDCTGCTETLLRTSQPDLGTLILNIISLDYHETVMAAAGNDAEAALNDAMKANDGKYVLIVEGSIPTKDAGVYLTIGGKKGSEKLQEVADHAAAVIAIGSCASWGGVPSSTINPTGAVGVDSIIKNKPVVNIPGCPPNPYVLLGTVLEYATTGKVPKLDSLGRPLFAYDRTIHDHCPRRAHFDAGEFAAQFGDEAHSKGWCLYKLGCKGPVTHAPCSTRHFNEVVDCWPIGIGAPCAGCTEKDVAFTVPLFTTVDIKRPVPPDFYPEVTPEHRPVSPVATGVAGLVGGALVGAGFIASKKLNEGTSDEKPKE
ncbi:MAG TPA: hydrogenase small subunit [Thermoanaerobaculia bacterium]|nr:hydrogenase small subunit [Thermoanaerobaculia bacterium]